MKKRKNILSLILVLSLALSFSGCGGGEKTKKSTERIDLNKLASSSYPLDTDKTLTWWAYRGGNVVGNYIDPAELPCLKEYEKNVGVDIDWVFATNGQEKEQFNLLLASGEIPDIVGYYWPTAFPGGADKAIKEGYIADLNKLIDDYAPNYKKFLSENPNGARELRTNGGKNYYIPSYATTDKQNGYVTCGYMMRKDWLDDLGLSEPETIEEWYKCLKAFKEKKNVEYPFTLRWEDFRRGFTGAFDISLGFYKDGNKVKYGYAEPEYKEFITEMNKWYKEGLIDKSIASVDDKSVSAKMSTGKAGASFGWLTSHMYNWTNAGKEFDKDYELVGLKYPVRNKGEKPRFGYRDPQIYFGGCAIGGKSENKEIAMKVLDYGFSKEGAESLTYGKENETFKLEDGFYKYTDLIANNKEGLSEQEAKSVYIRNSLNIPLLEDPEILDGKKEEKYALDCMKDAVEAWEYSDTYLSKVPDLQIADSSDSSDFARIKTDISSYCDEMFLKFIIGEEPIENYDKYLKELKNRGLDKMIEIMQKTYDDYLKK